MPSTPKNNNIGKNEHDHWKRKRKYDNALYLSFPQQAGGELCECETLIFATYDH